MADLALTSEERYFNQHLLKAYVTNTDVENIHVRPDLRSGMPSQIFPEAMTACAVSIQIYEKEMSPMFLSIRRKSSNISCSNISTTITVTGVLEVYCYRRLFSNLFPPLLRRLDPINDITLPNNYSFQGEHQRGVGGETHGTTVAGETTPCLCLSVDQSMANE